MLRKALSKIFSADKLTEGIYNASDKLVYTKEEKAELFTKLLTLYEPFKLAQRYALFIFSIPYVAVFTLAALIYAASAMTDPCTIPTGGEPVQACKGRQLVQVADGLVAMNHDNLSAIVLAIVGFYFFGGAVEGGVRAAKHGRRGKDSET